MDTKAIEKEIYKYSLTFEQLPITVDRIMRGMGYGDEGNEIFAAMVETILPTIPDLTDISCGFRIIQPEECTISKTEITVGELTFNSGKIITPRLRKAETLAFFVTSAGDTLEQKSKALMSGDDPLEGYIYDTIGSEIAEAAADWLEERLQEIIEPRQWKMTNRYSPGYCEWKTDEQHKLFSLLPDNFCGITLTDSALMLPIKSVSGVIGLGKNVKKQDYQCSLCELENCYKRKRNIITSG